MAMQRNYFTVLFFLKKSKLLKNGEAPICMRITINGKRAEVQIKRSIDVTKWNTQKECAIGREKKYQEINHYLDTIRTKILQIHRELEQDGKPITADIIKISGITSKNGRNDAKRLNIRVVTVSNDDKPKKRKTQRKADLRRRMVCKSLPVKE